MPMRAQHFCKHSGCANLVPGGVRYCADHISDELEDARRAQRQADARRGSSRKRGYTSRWDSYSKAFLSRAENQFCVLHMDDGCAVVAQCVDHIDPPDSPSDPRFWDMRNHQPACIHCNSVKGHRKIVGTFRFGVTQDDRGGVRR